MTGRSGVVLCSECVSSNFFCDTLPCSIPWCGSEHDQNISYPILSPTTTLALALATPHTCCSLLLVAARFSLLVAPDTLPAYPFQDTDPFLIQPETLPHIYFAGNQVSAGMQNAVNISICLSPSYSTSPPPSLLVHSGFDDIVITVSSSAVHCFSLSMWF